MPEIHYVTVQIGENRVIEGFYTIEGSEITMTYQDGEPVLVNNEKVQMKLSEGTTPRMLAGRMTREIRRALAGETVDGFTGPLRMPQAGFA
jgi:hypothetical protein